MPELIITEFSKKHTQIHFETYGPAVDGSRPRLKTVHNGETELKVSFAVKDPQVDGFGHKGRRMRVLSGVVAYSSADGGPWEMSTYNTLVIAENILKSDAAGAELNPHWYDWPSWLSGAIAQTVTAWVDQHYPR